MKQSEEIKAREAKSEEKKEAMIVKAQSDIDHFYQQYNANKAQAIARNKYVRSLQPSRVLTRWTKGGRSGICSTSN